MYCKKCGKLIEENAKFCGGCSTPAPIQNDLQKSENIYQNNNINSENYNQTKINSNYNPTYQNYDNIIRPNMKIYAICSIVIPVISLIVYYYIGISVSIAFFLSALGFNFAKKGKMYNNVLSIIGYILNGLLLGLAILGALVLFYENT